MIRLNCPNCGPRNVDEFRYGGEYNPRPPSPSVATDTEWADYIHMRHNKRGMQKEWWHHRAGCGIWFFAERHTGTNEVVRTYAWSPGDKEEPG